MRQNARQKQKKRSRRLIGWIMFYAALSLGFLAFLYQQGKHINTYSLPKGQIILSVSKPQYTVGDVVGFTIQNNLSNPIYVNNKCPQEPLNVYKWDSGNKTWTRLHETAKNDSCANQQRQVSIAADSSITSNYANWPDLFNKPGIYRLVVVADNYNGLVYKDFDVVAKPVKATPPPPTYIYQQVPIYIPSPSPRADD